MATLARFNLRRPGRLPLPERRATPTRSLAFGFGAKGKPPVLHEVAIPCHSVAHVPRFRMHSRSNEPTVREFPSPLPNHLLPARNGLLALSTLFVNDPYGWKLQATRIDLT